MSGPGVGPAAAAAVANGLLAGLNAGTNPSVLQIYGGAQPAAGLPGAGPLICEVELQRPAGVVSGGALQLAIDGAGGVAAVAATPTWARLLDGAGAWFLDLRARLSVEAEDPLDPQPVVVHASAVDVGALLRVTAGALSVLG